MNRKMLLGAGLAVSLFGVAACGSGADQDASQQPSSSQQESAEQGGEGSGQPTPQQPETPQPDLEGIPEVVAEVNGQEIGKDEFVSAYQSQFQRMATQAQTAGQQVNQEQLKKQTADNLVRTELLIQEAENREIQASAEEVDATLQELAQTSGMESGDALIAALSEQGIDESKVMDQLTVQVKVNQLIAQETGDIDPTETELRELYDQAAAQQKQAAGQGGEAPTMPPFEEVKPQLEQQIKSQKEGQAAQALLGQLRENADVTIHL